MCLSSTKEKNIEKLFGKTFGWMEEPHLPRPVLQAPALVPASMLSLPESLI